MYYRVQLSSTMLPPIIDSPLKREILLRSTVHAQLCRAVWQVIEWLHGRVGQWFRKAGLACGYQHPDRIIETLAHRFTGMAAKAREGNGFWAGLACAPLPGRGGTTRIGC